MANPFTLPTRLLWRFGDRRKILAYISLSVAANLAFLTEPLILAWLLNTIQAEGLVHPWKLVGIAALYPALDILFWSLHGPSRVIENRNAFIARANYRQYLIEGTMALPAEWHAAHHSGDTLDKVTRSADALHEYARSTFFTIEAVTRLVTSYVVMAFFNIHALYIVAGITVIAAYNVVKFDRKLSVHYRKLNEYENSVSAKVFDAISNITTVIILKAEKLLGKGIREAIRKPYPTYDKASRVTEVKWFLTDFSGTVMLFLILSTYVLSHLDSAIMIGTVAALATYVLRITMVFYTFTYRYGEIVRQETAIRNVEPIVERFEHVSTMQQTPMENWSALQVKSLSFSYHGTEGNLHLSGVSFAFRKGEKIALVGESGSGKTTFLKLLRGLYEPKRAEIALDGKPIGSFRQLSDAISLIPQEPELFATTVGENITLGLDIPKRRLDEVARTSTFAKVVPRLPRGYASLIMERGVNLSGGEKQRLALARGLLFSKGKQILLLDEPTSSVDSENERAIFASIFRKHRHTTVIASVHRLNLLPLFDTIYYFQKGNLVATGTLEQVRRAAPDFARLYARFSSPAFPSQQSL